MMKDGTKFIIVICIMIIVIVVVIVGAWFLHQKLFPSYETEKQYLLNRLEPKSPYDELDIWHIYEIKNGWLSVYYSVWDDDNGTNHYGSFRYHFTRDKFTNFDNDMEYIYDKETL